MRLATPILPIVASAISVQVDPPSVDFMIP